ncbi:MAG: hypothetical protein IPJ61_20310 [Tessaracoccus sp.]|uniref:hypothetical protein n=1 Tax=Tessaracoccus sp. TaxID=1971211 RepID=UPI001ED183B7|nr:hypothetical protein [Tessaracoccus sp.]MBK7823332.1 hypothetical protein [Tessaracoccus sp.]
MSLTHRLAECCLVPSPPGPWDVPWVASAPPRAGILPDGTYCLDPFAWPRVQVGGTCAGNAVAQAITTGLVLLGEPRVEVSGTGCWAQGQLWGAVEGADVDADAGAWVAKVLEACRVWGWPLRTDHAEEGLASLDASALGEIVARATGAFTIEHRIISESDCKDALHEQWQIVASGPVDEAFAAAKPGGWVDTCTSGGGHAQLIDGYSPAGYLDRDTWGRGVGEIEFEKKRLHMSVGWMKSRWELRAVRVVRR